MEEEEEEKCHRKGEGEQRNRIRLSGGRKGGIAISYLCESWWWDRYFPTTPSYLQQQAVIVIEKGKKTLIRNGGGNGGGREKCKCDFRIPLYYTTPPAFVRKAMLRDETKRASGKKRRTIGISYEFRRVSPSLPSFPLSLHPLRHVKKPFFGSKSVS